MTPKSFAPALLGIALILLAVVVVIIPASALGQCGEGDCGKIVKSDCATSERCVEKWGGYYCVDDPACSSAPSATGTPTAVTTTTATPAPSATGSSCSSAGGVCRYWTGFYCYSGESDVGKKDCGSGQTCCKKAAAAPKVTPTKTPTTPKGTPTPGGSCGDKSCGMIFKKECSPTERCVFGISGSTCMNDPSCAAAVPGVIVVPASDTCKAAGGVCANIYCVPLTATMGRKDCGFWGKCCKTSAASNSTCGNGICETGTGKESYLNCPADCPKPMSYQYKAQPNITSTVSKCPDGTPRFTCSNSTAGKYCDGLGKLVTLARCSAPSATTPAAVGGTCAAAGGACKFAAQSGDEDLGKKDCGYGRSCYRESEAHKQEQIDWLNKECGQKDCGVVSKKDCLQTQRCYSSVRMGAGKDCGYDERCAELNAANLQTYTYTKVFTRDVFLYPKGAGNYDIALRSIDTTGRTVLIEVRGLTGSTPASKIIREGTSYQFFSGNIDGGITVKVNAITGTSAELTVTYKG